MSSGWSRKGPKSPGRWTRRAFGMDPGSFEAMRGVCPLQVESEERRFLVSRLRKGLHK